MHEITKPFRPVTLYARRVQDFFHYMDSSADFWWLEKQDINQVRNEFATLLRRIRRGRWNWRVDLMAFFIDHYYLPSNGELGSMDAYNTEFLQIMREIQ